MRLPVRSSVLALLLLPGTGAAAGFFSNPHRVATLTLPLPLPQWETAEIGAVWTDDFNRAVLGDNWVIQNGAAASIVSNQLQFAEATATTTHRMYYAPWRLCSDAWTLRWTQRFAATNASSYGVGFGLYNFQAAGGNDRGYNAVFYGAGTDAGRMEIERWDGSTRTTEVQGNPIAFAPGNAIDCWFTRSGWTLTATASNRANAQVSTTAVTYTNIADPFPPTISRACFYPLGGTVWVDDVSYTINHRKPARFLVAGDSISDGANASAYRKTYVSVIQSNFVQTVCNDSSSYNSTSNTVSVLPEILAHQPGTVVLMIGGNDLQFGYPASQWQSQYTNLVSQLLANGVLVKHCLPTPRNGTDLRPLRDFIQANYAATNIIDVWTPMVTNGSQLQAIYDSGDGVHPNDAGHLLIGSIIRTNLP
jgi:lysophospholipase L1-like esterase